MRFGTVTVLAWALLTIILSGGCAGGTTGGSSNASFSAAFGSADDLGPLVEFVRTTAGPAQDFPDAPLVVRELGEYLLELNSSLSPMACTGSIPFTAPEVSASWRELLETNLVNVFDKGLLVGAFVPHSFRMRLVSAPALDSMASVLLAPTGLATSGTPQEMPCILAAGVEDTSGVPHKLTRVAGLGRDKGGAFLFLGKRTDPKIVEGRLWAVPSLTPLGGAKFRFADPSQPFRP